MNKHAIFSVLVVMVLSMTGCKVKPNYDITSEELLDHLSYLASEELAGRFPGTEGDKAAADYILEKFEEYGLEVTSPAGLQEIEVTTSVVLGEDNKLSWRDKHLELDKDFLPLSYTSNEELSGEVVFAGYGISAEKEGLSRDDFNGIDFKGKIALILEGGPDAPEEGSDPYDGLLSQRSKILMAQDRGATAVIFVAGPLFDEADNLEFTNVKESPSGIPAVRISRALGNMILADKGFDIENLEQECQLASKGAIELGETVFIKTDVVSEVVKTHNVIGILRAPNPVSSEEFIVFGGHFDHLGMGGPGTGTRVPGTNDIHYGADDNASGTAGVIELAGYYAGKKAELKKTMVFVAFAAEEMGLLGSKYFAENPPVELDQISAMINLDMIGRLNEENRLSIGGTGTAAEFDSLLNIVEKGELDLRYSPEGSGPSDHASFYAKDIPVMFISTGAHPDYHTPGDSVGNINIDGLFLVTKYVADLGTIIDDQDHLSFKEAGPKRAVGGRQNLKVTLGFMPDFTDNSNKGLKVDFPTPGKPAARAGIKKGDVIIGINGLKVTNIQDYMVRLKTLEPGQIVTVEILRDNEKEVLLVQL